MNRRHFLAGLLASTAAPALPDLGQVPKPFMVSFDNLSWEMPEVISQDWQYVVRQINIPIPKWVGTNTIPDIKWRKICAEGE